MNAGLRDRNRDRIRAPIFSIFLGTVSRLFYHEVLSWPNEHTCQMAWPERPCIVCTVHVCVCKSVRQICRPPTPPRQILPDRFQNLSGRQNMISAHISKTTKPNRVVLSQMCRACSCAYADIILVHNKRFLMYIMCIINLSGFSVRVM